MKLNEIIAKYNNQYWKVLPNNLSPQCFDLAVGWTDNLGVPHYPNNPSPFPYANASQIYTDFGTWQAQYFDRIQNTPTGVPQAGDIIVWSNSYGGVGHVAVVVSANVDNFVAFSQNDPLGSKCIQKTYNYNFVLGWLRCKLPQTQPVDDCPAKLKQVTEERDRLNKVIEGKDKEIEDLKNQNSTCNSSLASLTAEKNSLAVQLSECQKTSLVYKEAYDALPQVKEEVVELVRQKQVWIDKEIQLGKEYKALQTRYLNLKKPGLKFMQDALIRLCEKMGVEL